MQLTVVFAAFIGLCAAVPLPSSVTVCAPTSYHVANLYADDV